MVIAIIEQGYIQRDVVLYPRVSRPGTDRPGVDAGTEESRTIRPPRVDYKQLVETNFLWICSVQ